MTEKERSIATYHKLVSMMDGNDDYAVRSDGEKMYLVQTDGKFLSITGYRFTDKRVDHIIIYQLIRKDNELVDIQQIYHMNYNVPTVMEEECLFAGVSDGTMAYHVDSKEMDCFGGFHIEAYPFLEEMIDLLQDMDARKNAS